jgi:hypothetical protein
VADCGEYRQAAGAVAEAAVLQLRLSGVFAYRGLV